MQGWELFLSHLQKLNQAGPAKYKLFYVIRHGEGDHNVKEAQVGRFEWEACPWTLETYLCPLADHL